MSNRYADANLKIFSLNSNPELAKEIADRIGVDVGKSSVKRFSDGEVKSILKKVSVAVIVMLFNLLVRQSMSTLWSYSLW